MKKYLQQASNRSRVLSIYSLAFGNFAASVSAMIVVGISPEMASDLNVSIGQIGLLVTFFAIAYAIGSPLFALLFGSINRRILLIMGMASILVGNGVIVVSESYEFVLLGRILAALGAATYVPLAALVAFSLAKPEEKGRVSAIVFAGAAVATTIGVPIGTYVGITFGWRYNFFAIAVLALLTMMAIYRTIPKTLYTADAKLKSLKEVFSHSLLPVFLAVTILQFGGQMVLFSYISPWLKSLTSLGASGLTMMMILIGIGGIIGNIIAGQWTDRYGSRMTQLVLIAGLLLIMPSLNIIAESVFWGGILVFLWGLVGQGFVAPQLVRIVNAQPSLASISLSLNASFINVGISLGAFIGGLFIEYSGVESLTWVAAAVIFISFIVFIISWIMENMNNHKMSVSA